MDTPLRILIIVDTGLEMGRQWGSYSCLEYTKLVLENWVRTKDYWMALSNMNRYVQLVLVDGGKSPSRKEDPTLSRWEVAYRSPAFIPLMQEHGIVAQEFSEALSGFEAFGESHLQTALRTMDFCINQTEPSVEEGPYFDSSTSGYCQCFDSRNPSSHSVIITITSSVGLHSCNQVPNPHWKQPRYLFVFTPPFRNSWECTPLDAVQTEDLTELEKLSISSGGYTKKLHTERSTSSPLLLFIAEVISININLGFAVSFTQGDKRTVVRFDALKKVCYPLPRTPGQPIRDNLPQYYVTSGVPDSVENITLPKDAYETQQESLIGVEAGCVSLSPDSPPFAVLLPGKLIVLPYDFKQVQEALGGESVQMEVLAEVARTMPTCYTLSGSLMLSVLQQPFNPLQQKHDEDQVRSLQQSVSLARSSASIVTTRKRRAARQELQIIEKSDQKPSKWWDNQHLDYRQRLASLRTNEAPPAAKIQKIKLDQSIPVYKKSILTPYQEATLASMTSGAVGTSAEVMGGVSRAQFISTELAAHTAEHQREHNRPVTVMSDTSYLPRTQLPTPLRMLPSTKLPPWFVSSERASDSSKFKKMKQSAAVRLGFDSPTIPSSVPAADGVIDIRESGFVAAPIKKEGQT
eukprot:TRINITY_DN31129_c0_g1_i1.p1 TRINITY_DN31129_c0_g1~~TRINITY_DN31129_c0_g1_i1.p1  ORF type:complete len:667 (+),score=105.07 TRINITY_DN31129_c0_g1_i1:105-2003(+)